MSVLLDQSLLLDLVVKADDDDGQDPLLLPPPPLLRQPHICTLRTNNHSCRTKPCTTAITNPGKNYWCFLCFKCQPLHISFLCVI